jgi:hypothetical protein
MNSRLISIEGVHPFSRYFARNFRERIDFLDRHKDTYGVELCNKEIANIKAFKVLEEFYKNCNLYDLESNLGLNRSTTLTINDIHNYCKKVLEVIKTLEEDQYTRENDHLHGFFGILKLVFYQYDNLFDIYMHSTQSQLTGLNQQQQEVIPPSLNNEQPQINREELSEENQEGQAIRHNSQRRQRPRQRRNIRLLSSSSSSDESSVPSRQSRQSRQPSSQIRLLPEVDNVMQEINHAQSSLPMNTLTEHQFIAGLNMLLMNFNNLLYYQQGLVQEIKNAAIFETTGNQGSRINDSRYYAQLLQTLTDLVNRRGSNMGRTAHAIKGRIIRQINEFKSDYFQHLRVDDNRGGGKVKKLLKKNK